VLAAAALKGKGSIENIAVVKNQSAVHIDVEVLTSDCQKPTCRGKGEE